MILKDILNIADAECIYDSQNMEKEIKYAFAADLLSDVLTVNTEEMLLITGTANLQVIRTAEMSDISFILFVRGKNITEEMRELAEENGITLLRTKSSMFKACGKLYEAGLKAIF